MRRRMWSRARPGVATTTSTPAPQAAELLRDRLAAVDGHHPRPQVAPVAVQGLRHLHGQLARRDEHEDARLLALARRGQRPLQQRKGEGGRLAGAGGRLSHEVAPGQQRGDRVLLDGRRLLVAELLQHRHQLRTEAEVGESGSTRPLGLRAGHQARVNCSSPSPSSVEVSRSPALSQTCLSFG